MRSSATTSLRNLQSVQRLIGDAFSATNRNKIKTPSTDDLVLLIFTCLRLSTTSFRMMDAYQNK